MGRQQATRELPASDSSQQLVRPRPGRFPTGTATLRTWGHAPCGFCAVWSGAGGAGVQTEEPAAQGPPGGHQEAPRDSLLQVRAAPRPRGAAFISDLAPDATLGQAGQATPEVTGAAGDWSLRPLPPGSLHTQDSDKVQRQTLVGRGAHLGSTPRRAFIRKRAWGRWGPCLAPGPAQPTPAYPAGSGPRTTAPAPWDLRECHASAPPPSSLLTSPPTPRLDVPAA